MRARPTRAMQSLSGSPSSARCVSSVVTSPDRPLFPPDHLEQALADARAEILERPNPPRRQRTNPRAIKRHGHNSYPVKKNRHTAQRHAEPPTIVVLAKPTP